MKLTDNQKAILIVTGGYMDTLPPKDNNCPKITMKRAIARLACWNTFIVLHRAGQSSFNRIHKEITNQIG